MLTCKKVLRKAPPKFYPDCRSFVISVGSWGRSVLSCQKVLRKAHHARFYQSFTKIAQGSWSPVFWGRFVHELPKGSAGGSTKVPPIVSLAFWGRSVLSCQKVLGRFHQGSTKVLPRLPKFRNISGSSGAAAR